MLGRLACLLRMLNPYAIILQVILLTREVAEGQTGGLNAAAAAAESTAAAIPYTPSLAAGEQLEQLVGLANLAEAAKAQPTGASSTVLPPQVAEQIRHAQQRAALGGHGPAAWAVGAKCKAVYSGDGNW